MTNNCGIYQITNTINGNFYIGSSVNIKSRLRHHRWMLVHGSHDNQHLQRAWSKWGAENFTFETILLCDEYMTLYCEQEILEQFQPAYNIAFSATAPMQGHHHTDAAREKIAAGNRGKVVSEETCAKISAAKMGHKMTEEQNRKNRERTVTAETRLKLSIAGKRYWAKRKAEKKLGERW